MGLSIFFFLPLRQRSTRMPSTRVSTTITPMVTSPVSGSTGVASP